MAVEAQPRAGDDLLRKMSKDEFEMFTFHISYFCMCGTYDHIISYYDISHFYKSRYHVLDIVEDFMTFSITNFAQRCWLSSNKNHP